jgi:hypothetical protein
MRFNLVESTSAGWTRLDPRRGSRFEGATGRIGVSSSYFEYAFQKPMSNNRSGNMPSLSLHSACSVAGHRERQVTNSQEEVG